MASTRAKRGIAPETGDGGGAESPAKKTKKDKDKSKTAEAQQEAMADAMSEANMVAEEDASGDASSKDKGRHRTDRTELLESRKERDEARKEAEELKRRLQKLEEDLEKTSGKMGKTSEKSSDKSVFTFFPIPYKIWLDTYTFLGSQSPPVVATRSKRRNERRCLAMTTLPMPSTMVLGLSLLGLSAPFVVYIKETVFGVRDGAPLMDRSHPCLAALAAAYTGACNCV